MYNGIGLTTPRGSGTNGYVMRNLSALRHHDSPQDRAAAWDAVPPKHREPDQSILDHEKKRGVEVKCLELQLELEDKGMDEEQIEKEVDELRRKLLTELNSAPSPAKPLKPSDSHGIAAAKKTELSKMARALGTRSNYVEGDAFDKDKQAEFRARRAIEREDRDRLKEEERARWAAQKERWEAEKKEKERLRRRQEDQARTGPTSRRDRVPDRGRMLPPPSPGMGRNEGGYHRLDAPRDSENNRDGSPPPPSKYRAHDSPPHAAHVSRRRRPRSASSSVSPPPRSRRRIRSISRSPRSDSRSPTPSQRYEAGLHGRSRSRGLPISRSPSPRPRRSRGDSPTRLPNSPPRPGATSPDRRGSALREDRRDGSRGGHVRDAFRRDDHVGKRESPPPDYRDRGRRSLPSGRNHTSRSRSRSSSSSMSVSSRSDGSRD